MKNLDNRKQKLSFLKDLSTGRANIADILPPTTEFYQKHGDGWQNEVSGELITNEQLKAKQERAQRSASIVWLEEKAY